MNPLHRSLNQELAVRASLAPVAGTGAAQNGGWVDRRAFRAAIAAVAYQTAGGATGGTVTVKVQDATDNTGTGAADLSTAQAVTVAAGPNAGGVIEHDVNLAGSRDFVRVVVTSAPTGGTPTSIVSAFFVFGNPINRAAA